MDAAPLSAAERIRNSPSILPVRMATLRHAHGGPFGGGIAMSHQNIPFFLGVGVVITLFYRFLWCMADGDTPGMRFAGLTLVDFDGRKPDREQRGMRQIAGILSFLSAGLGLVWALVDEESLTWHDHISKTFPTIG